MKYAWIISVSSIALVAQGSSAHAEQAQTQAAGQEEAAAPSVGLADIVVTAQRRSENLQRAAVAITAISPDVLRNAGVTKPTELTALVPALQIATAAGPYSVFYIRGVGNFNSNAFSDSAIAFNTDGVFVGRPSSTTGFFYDLERIEVLKGPQGTLYGRNATGGAINVISKAPALDALAGSISAEYGNYDAARIDGMINAPLGEGAALRVAAMYVRHDGYLSDGTDDQKDYGGRASLKLTPASNLTMVLRADYFHQGGRGAGSTPIALDPSKRLGLTGPEAQNYYTQQRVSIAGRNFAPVQPRQFLDNTYWGASADIKWEVPVGTIAIIPAYREGSLDFVTTSPGFQVTQREKDKQTSIEARIASPTDSRLSYLAGVFYYKEQNDLPRYSVNSQFNISFQNVNLKTKSAAAFGRLGYALTDTLKLSVGGRYTTEDKSVVGTNFGYNQLCLPIPTALCPNAVPYAYDNYTQPSLTFIGQSAIPAFSPTTGILETGAKISVNQRAKFKRFTYRLAADWEITPKNLLYVSYETGFKSGGFFFSSDNGTYKPEKLKAYTIGSKNRFWGNRVQLNLEAFHWKYTDQQISHLGQDSQGIIIFPTENVGNATMKGFEAETKFLVTPITELSADVQYVSAKYDSFVYHTPAGGGPPLTGCPVAFAPSSGFAVNCSGRRPINSPEWTINLGIQQTIPLAGDRRIVLNARTHYQTGQFTGLDYTPLEYQGSYWMSDLSATFSTANDRFHLTGFVNNVENTTVVGNTFQPVLSSFVVGSVRPPRTYGVRVGFNF